MLQALLLSQISLHPHSQASSCLLLEEMKLQDTSQLQAVLATKRKHDS